MSARHTVTVAALNVYPVKSCGGIALSDALLAATGLEFDRQWMVVDADTGVFVTQRELPRMAQIHTTLTTRELMLQAPGMPALQLSLDIGGVSRRVKVWDDELAATDMGGVAARWFSSFLYRPLRMVRFDPRHRRLSESRWAGDIEAENRFTDGYPLMVASTESLAELNRHLRRRDAKPVTMARFRPNIVLDGLAAHGEDFVDDITFTTSDGPVTIRLVKPCAPCAMANVDPLTGEPGTEPGDTLAGYRADARLDGEASFGMSAVIVRGQGCVLRTGMRGEARPNFESYEFEPLKA